MSQTNINNNITNITAAASKLGLAMMAVATMAGLVEVPEHGIKKAVLSSQPIFAFAQQSRDTNPLRREREEAGPHYVSYSAFQRTPGRTGKF